MITGIEIQNFKGIGERQSIDFAPLTLLFGANSAGKSTVVQAIHYFGQALRTGNGDVDEIQSTDRLLRLGGFDNLVHRKNEEPGIAIRLSVRAEKPDQFAVSLDNCAPLFKALDLEQLPKLFPQVNSVGIEITTKKLFEGYNNRVDHPLVERLVLFIDGEQFLETEATTFMYDEQVMGRFGNIANVNFDHSLLRANGVGEQMRKWASVVEFSANPMALEDDIRELPVEIENCLGAIPTRNSLSVGLFYVDLTDQEGMKDAGYTRFKSMLLGLLLDSIEYIQRMVESMAHVGPLREIPSRSMVSGQLHVNSLKNKP